MKFDKRKIIFICQIAENGLTAIKYSVDNSHKSVFLAYEYLPISADSSEAELAGKIGSIFKKLEYNGNLVILSLPHKFAACRYLRIPAQAPQEIENIAALQAAAFFPSSSKELVTGYSIISSGKQGYSDINLVIAQKDIIDSYFRVLGKLGVKKFKITLSSHGFSNLRELIEPGEPGPAMLIEIDFPKVELAVVSKGGLIFSRSFNVAGPGQEWLSLFVEEVNKTREAYLKEIPDKGASRIFIVGAPKNYKIFEEISGRLHLPVKVVPYWEVISCAESFRKSIESAGNSLAGIIGLGLKEIPESMNLIPQDLKVIKRSSYERKEIFWIAALILATALVLRIAAAKSLDNKALYLKQLSVEMKKIEVNAKKLEGYEKRLELMRKHLTAKPTSLDIIQEVFQIIPGNLSLVNFNYEESKQVTLRGQSAELTPIFSFVSRLENSPVFKKFQPKVKYAGKKKTPAGEVIDFEISCAKINPNE
ncbi:MAG: PilN domain-containing protein [Candidatus Omnitrophota bacterium]